MGEAGPLSELRFPAGAFTPEQTSVSVTSFQHFFGGGSWGWGGERKDWLGWERGKEMGLLGKVDLGTERDTTARAQGTGLASTEAESQGQRERACTDKARVLETPRRW